MKTLNIETMAKHYLIAAMWADCPEGTNPRITKQAEKQALETCAKFSGMICSDLWPKILENPDYWAHPDCGGKPEAAIGHDLYLTSAGHGVGFWARDSLPDDLREKLSALCGWRKPIPEPEVSFYRGWMYL
jgi:hypothetical protein